MDELEFVRSCVKGDRRSWDKFLTRYSPLIYNYIYQTFRIHGYRFREEEIEDIYQELFHSLLKDNFRKLSSYQGKNGCSLASWLRQVVINFTLSHLRRVKNTALSLDQEDEEGAALKNTLKDVSVSAQGILLSAERLQTLEECIDLLDSDDKYFIELYLNRNLSLEEIREHLHLKRGAVDMRKGRLMNRLKDCFKSKGFQLDSGT